MGEIVYRVITISREYGSGGAAIAGGLASKLGWRLLDRAVISELARAAHVDPALARAYDERLDSWVHRVSRRALWRGAFEQIASVTARDFFDAETMAALSTEVITQAADQGECVIVGRGAQCLLQGRSDTFHIFVYAPVKLKLDRLRSRLTGVGNLEERAQSMDNMRADYIRAHFGCDWKNPHLYDLMINSGLGDGRAIEAILCAVQPRALNA
ncbi:MAG TPA: cytidylate kinase-like family protein [Bryobacteraceae bacterium]|nr:cytidylate kinase-like family protein [Bryobacteraceae bacterium]